LEARGRNEPQEGSKKPFVKGDRERVNSKEMEEITLQSRKRERTPM
jgi:hypothetical protein